MKRTNPLSDARNSFSLTSKDRKEGIPHKAAALWHKKSGAGYSLFVQYYSGQPSGVVVDSNVQSTKSNAEINDLDYVGGSRAAKRRRRNKLKTSPSLITNESSVNRNSYQQLSYQKPSELIQVYRVTPSSHHLIDFITCLNKPQPLTLRVRHVTREKAESRLPMLLQQLSHHSSLIHPIDDSPEGIIFQANDNLCKENLKTVAPDLHQLLIEASISGLIARQDIGSMLPVLALSSMGFMKFGSRVLDLCASPGNKTMQALEIIASPKYTERERDKQQKLTKNTTTTEKRGRIVSNDISQPRLVALQEAVERSGMPTPLLKRITYTNHDATSFPTPKSTKLFDCVIADVPCSGDGTIRKDKSILPGWRPNIGNSLHEVQLRILQRALELTRVGGVVAYSTCSLNPVENEAVVGAALRWANADEKAVLIIDWPHPILPFLKRRQGVSSWRVAHHEFGSPCHKDISHSSFSEEDDVETCLTWFDSLEQAQSSETGLLPATLWPRKEYESYSLDKCTRLWPQDQNTGGFFLALFIKNKDIHRKSSNY